MIQKAGFWTILDDLIWKGLVHVVTVAWTRGATCKTVVLQLSDSHLFWTLSTMEAHESGL
jgi:hypothetical protein